MRNTVLLIATGFSVLLGLVACGQDSEVTALGKQPEQPFPSQRSDTRGFIPPYNEAPLEPALDEYINKLIAAVDKKDKEFLLSVIDDSTRFTYGSERGREEFARLWKLENNADESPVWPVLKDVLSLRGGFYGEGRSLFVAPYYFVLWPQEWIPQRHFVVVGENVGLFDTADVSGNVIDTMNYEIVRNRGTRTPDVTIGGDTYPWHQVETFDNQRGWVFGKYLRSPTSHRIGFKNENGNWRIVFFVEESEEERVN